MRPVANDKEDMDTASRLIRSMLPTLRDEFRSLIPVKDEPAPSELHCSLRKVTMDAVLTRAQVLVPKLGFKHEDAAYHVIGTTREIFHDLKSYFATAASAGAPERAKSIEDRQNALYRAMDQFRGVDEPMFFDTQLIVCNYTGGDMAPAVPKKPVFGFGN